MKKTRPGKTFECRSCFSTNVIDIISLGDQPLANNLSYRRNQEVNKYPLDLMFCKDCKLFQLKYAVEPKELFDSYLYVSSTSKVFVDHFERFADKIVERFNPDKVLDIGSNDGVLVKALMDKKVGALGIDPAENLVKECNKQNIPTILGYFEKKHNLIKDNYGKFDVITACNVFAHIKDIHGVIRGVDNVLKKNGVFIIEVAHVSEMINKGYFDMIYHEHLFYYSVLSLQNLLRQYGFLIYDVEMVNTHGGSIRAYAVRDATILDNLKFAGIVHDNKKELLGLLNSLSDKRIIGYGAPAKATTMIYYYGMDHIKYIIDDNKLKQNKYIPGTDIQITNNEMLKEADYVLIFAWNFADSIMKNCRKLGYNGKFIIPLPRVVVK